MARGTLTLKASASHAGFTVHKNKIYDEIFCFADDQAKRDEWISIFRGMGVATFDSGALYKRENK